MNRARQAAHQRGHWGEAVAAWWLRLQGWRILGQRIKTRQGEVDLIARRGQVVAFVEVKARKDAEALALSIDERRLARVAAAANGLASRYAGNGEDIRIDVILVMPWRFPVHLKNVWLG
jgi:putative endonuclease